MPRRPLSCLPDDEPQPARVWPRRRTPRTGAKGKAQKETGKMGAAGLEKSARRYNGR